MKYRFYNTADNGDHRSRNTPKPIAGVMDKLMASLGISRHYHGWQVVSNWEKIVGDRISRVSRAVRFEDGVLYVAVDRDTWRQELSMQAESILRKIREYPYGRVVTQLRFVRGEKGI